MCDKKDYRVGCLNAKGNLDMIGTFKKCMHQEYVSSFFGTQSDSTYDSTLPQVIFSFLFFHQSRNFCVFTIIVQAWVVIILDTATNTLSPQSTF